MTLSQAEFPLRGVIGIVDSAVAQLELAVQRDLQCVELRADLLRTAGFSDAALIAAVQDTKKAGLACLFTLRHADQGGTFDGAETERVELCGKALDAGADIVDLEHGTDAATALLATGAPMILSYHNFNRMLTQTELLELSDAMESLSPAAVKIIPTGASVADAATMLAWVAAAGQSIQRIGFTMGAEGACSRIISIAHGAPITYASFGEPVAPGQVDIDALLNRYHVMNMTKHSRVVALVGEPDQVKTHLATFSAAANDSPTLVHVAFPAACKAELELHRAALNFSDIITL